MKAIEAKERSNFSIKEKKRKQKLLESLNPVFIAIEKACDKGKYSCSFKLETLSINQRVTLERLGYSLHIQNQYSNFLGSFIKWG